MNKYLCDYKEEYCEPEDCKNCEQREVRCSNCGCYEAFGDLIDGLCDDCEEDRLDDLEEDEYEDY